MRYLFISLFYLCFSFIATAQVTIGATAAPQTSTMLEVRGNGNKAFLLPRLADTVNITNPVGGMQIYDSVNRKMYIYTTKWMELSTDSTVWLRKGNQINSSNAFIGTTDSADLLMKTWNIERFRITPKGNIGINTGIPSEKLHINGNVKLGSKKALLIGDSSFADKPVMFAFGDPHAYIYGINNKPNGAYLVVNDSLSTNMNYQQTYSWVAGEILNRSYKHTGGINDTATLYEIDNEPVLLPGSTGYFSEASGNFTQIYNFGTGKVQDLYGMFAGAVNGGNNTTDRMGGIYARSYITDYNFTTASVSNTGEIYGGYFYNSFALGNAGSAANINKAYAVFANSGFRSGYNTKPVLVDSSFGVYIDRPFTSPSITYQNNFGIYLENMYNVSPGNNYAFTYNGLSPVVIDGYGKMGIGTKNPDEALHVKGNARISSMNSLLLGDRAINNVIRVYEGPGGNNYYIDKLRNNVINYSDSIVGNLAFDTWANVNLSFVNSVNHTGSRNDLASYGVAYFSPQIQTSSTGAFDYTVGIEAGPNNYSNGYFNHFVGIRSYAVTGALSDTIENAYGLWASAIRENSVPGISFSKTKNLTAVFADAFIGNFTDGSSVKVDSMVGIKILTGTKQISGTAVDITSNASLYIHRPYGSAKLKDNYAVYIDNQPSTSGLNYAFYYNSNQPLVITGNGNLGVGVANPSEKLEVNGKIKATAVNFSGLPVFENDTSAGAGGMLTGDLYRTAAGDIKIKL